MALSIGDMAPDFTLPIQGNGELTLSSLKGKKVVIYFYPKDMTPGCTTESKDFRDAHDQFKALNTEIIGISKDSVARHDKFIAKHDLPFDLVSDEEGEACEAYGVWQLKKFMGKEFMGIVRTTFLINEEGKIEQIWNKVRVKGHVDAVLEAVKNS
ncbi:thioredoxin-dependent thiol peroxidase [Curvivirga sp.]|uniref:thioredoxin-dependent thiol peroxidase n=1 Tax=Curvivirga sp. TaxID=2856848 RepID=UPI003B5B660B